MPSTLSQTPSTTSEQRCARDSANNRWVSPSGGGELHAAQRGVRSRGVHIFCQVIDNHGDLGVCWRLAADLASRGETVVLWVDDAAALAWMAPHGAPGVTVLPWTVPLAPALLARHADADVLVEAFGCTVAPEFIAACAASTGATSQFGVNIPPVWINLEYLSAEPYVERCHALPSPVRGGAADGWTKWFFYPGFTTGTGGLLREPALAGRLARFDRAAWRRAHGVADGALAISLFCYEPPALGDWLAMLATLADAGTPVQLLVTPGRAQAAVARHFGPDGSHALPGQRSISYLDATDQAGFDELLWACDWNLVRGEDSLVRALWAGRPFVWQPYPQADGAHAAKLAAFLDWLQAPESLCRFHHAWSGLHGAALVLPDTATLGQWADCAVAARTRLLAQPDLATQLRQFACEKR